MANNASSAPLTTNEEKIPMLVHVIAPATLTEGYTFEAEVNGNPDQIITCEVPEGGVTEGQLFLAPLPDTFDNPRLRIPTGKWKDGLFDCGKVGWCNPSTCCAIFCSQVATAQVASRLTLSWLGEAGSWEQAQRAFQVAVTLIISFVIYSTALEVAAWPYEQGYEPLWVPLFRFSGNIFFTGWSMYFLCRTRETVRARYQIPEQHCQGCEDLVCSVFCSCCTAAQLLRHTGEYETYPAVCCTKTGHAPDTPISV